MSESWLDLVKRIGRESRQKRHLEGVDHVRCSQCAGRGSISAGHCYDSYVGESEPMTTSCKHCDGRGHHVVPCAPELQAAAIRAEIEKLRGDIKTHQKRLRALEKGGER